MDGDTILGGHILEFQHKLPVCQVGHLPAPEGRHASELQVFNEDPVVLLAQLMGELPLKGIALIDHLIVVTVETRRFRSRLWEPGTHFERFRDLRCNWRSPLFRNCGLSTVVPSLIVMYFFSPKSIPTDAPLCDFPMD